MSCITGTNIKPLKLTALFLVSPLFFFAQSLTGLWTGTLSNDSNTVRKDQLFEIALTEYRGKVYGYSRSEFIVNDTLFYIVKRVKGTIEDDVCEVTDDEILSYNFRGKLDKGVKVTSTFRRNQTDSSWYLDGTWKTNATKKYYSVTGKVGLENEKDLNASKLFPHLEELNIAKDVAFYKEFKEKKDEPIIVKVAHPEKIITVYNDRPQPVLTNNGVAIIPAKPTIQKTIPEPAAITSAETKAAEEETETQTVFHADKNPVSELPKTDYKNIPASTVSVNPEPVSKTIAVAPKPEKINLSEKTNTSVSAIPVEEKREIRSMPVAKTEVKKEQPVVKTQSSPTKQPVVAEKKPETKITAIITPVPEKKEVAAVVIPEEKKPTVDVIAKSAVIEGRKSEFSQVVNFKTDSLVLSLYDNGEIDGDTVSVFMNGEVLMAKQGLKSKAIKKTIYITKANEEFTLVMFADNLGIYPPNTGLLVVHDGEDIYNLRFSSDLQKSAGIVFRRKK